MNPQPPKRGLGLVCIILLTGMMSQPVDAAGKDHVVADSDNNVTVTQAVVNPFSNIGKHVAWEGTVKIILASGMPMKVLIQSGSHEWILHSALKSRQTFPTPSLTENYQA